jgi:hypothetical protein
LLAPAGRVGGYGVVVRSLNVEDQHRLVEAILRIGAMRVRRDRRLYLNALERELGHRLDFVHHDQDKLDVWALVDACLEYPGAAHALVEVLETFHSGSLSVRALGELVHELLPDPWLGKAARRDLHQLISELERADPGLSHLTRFAMLYRRAVGPAWPLLDRELRSLHEIVAILEEIPAAGDGTPPLLIFVRDLAEYVGGTFVPAFRDWVGRQAAALGLADGLLQPQWEQGFTRTMRQPSDTYLVIECAPDVIEPDRYLVTAWLQVDGEPGTTLHCDEVLPLSRIPELLESLLTTDSTVVGRPNPDLTIEFILPRGLLDHPVEQFKINVAGLEYRIGIKYPVVIRSLDRLRLAAIHHGWRHKWTWLRGNPSNAKFYLVDHRGQYDQEELFSTLSDVSPVVLALAFAPWADPSGEPDEHWVGLLAGVPVIVWCRDDRDPAHFAEEIKDLLAADLMALPWRTMQLRRQALSLRTGDSHHDHVGLHLSLIFDDADRIPEPYVRLRPPA